jgi:hypothetical protein
MAYTKLLGNETGTPVYSASGAYWRIHKYQAALTGQVYAYRFLTNASGYIKVCLYAADGAEGLPGTILAVNNNSTAIISGWNLINFAAPAPVTKDTLYWLAEATTPTTNVTYAYPITGVIARYKALPDYNSFTFPASPPDLINLDYYTSFIAGYGSLLLLPSSISQPTATGTPIVTLIWPSKTLYPDGFTQPIAYGTPKVELTIGPS